MNNSHISFLLGGLLSFLLLSCSRPDCSRFVIATDSLYRYVEDNNLSQAMHLYKQGHSPYEPCTGSLLHALRRTSDSRIVQFVLDLNLDPEYENPSGNTAIYYLSGYALHEILKRGADTRHRNRRNETPLYYQVEIAIWSESQSELKQKMDDIDVLCSYGADINSKVNGKTLLDNVLNAQTSYSPTIAWEPVERRLANRAELYPFLRSRGAKLSKELP